MVGVAIDELALGGDEAEPRHLGRDIAEATPGAMGARADRPGDPLPVDIAHVGHRQAVLRGAGDRAAGWCCPPRRWRARPRGRPRPRPGGPRARGALRRRRTAGRRNDRWRRRARAGPPGRRRARGRRPRTRWWARRGGPAGRRPSPTSSATRRARPGPSLSSGDGVDLDGVASRLELGRPVRVDADVLARARSACSRRSGSAGRGPWYAPPGGRRGSRVSPTQV